MTDSPRRAIEASARWLIPLGLVAVTFAIYGQTAGHSFINVDDEILIYANPQVRSGLSWENLAWAFTSTSGASFWHPLTWLSLMADVELFGLRPGGHHLVSAGIHALNAIVLFFALRRMTGSPLRSGFVAALFAVHPLHVESVAWAAERKDVLSVLFLMLALWAYARYAERPGGRRYGLVVLFFVLSLMSKPMGITFPFVLLLLDYWPLGRVGGMAPEGGETSGRFPPAQVGRILGEKAPLLLLAAGSLAVTLGYDGGESWIGSLGDYPLWVRAANAVVSYATYLWQTAWPANLAVYYPHPGRGIALWKVAAGGVVLAAATVLALRSARRRPYLPVGWFLFVGTLVPVIGLLQIGGQAMADRFTYLPLVGIFIAVAWGVPDAARSWRRRKPALAAAAALLLATLSIAAWAQAGYWRDSMTLYARALAVTDGNWFALNNLGVAHSRLRQYDRAIACYREALRIRPDFADAWHNLGVAHDRLGMYDRAIAFYEEALRARPDYADAWNSMGVAYGALGNFRRAIECCREALRLRADYADAWNNLGAAHDGLGLYNEAVSCYREALRIRPDAAEWWNNMGIAYARLGQREQADACFRQAQALRSSSSDRPPNL